MRRYLVFLHYDPDGHVDNAVLHTLRGLRPHVERILVVSNGFLQAESRERLAAEVDEVFERENVGFDAGAYRSALGRIGYDALADYDELLLINYTFFGPVDSFDELFARMDARPVDFWGMTHHVDVDPHPIIGKGIMPEHIQSYWIGFRKSLFGSEDFRRYWSRMRDAWSYNDVVTIFETELTKHFSDLGYVWESAYPNDKFNAQNISMEAPLQLLDDGCPMFKRRIYFHDLADMDHRGVSGKEITDRAVELGYPRDLIVDGIIRRASVRQLSTGLGLTFVHDRQATASTTDEIEVEDASITILDEPFWATWLRDGVSPFDQGDTVAVSAPRVEDGMISDAAVGGRRRAMNAVIGHWAENLAALEQDARVGLIVPLTEHRATALLADGWRGGRKAAERLAKLLGLRGPLDPHAPLTPFDGIAMYRSAALAELPERIRRAGGWSALAGQFGGDEELSELLDLLAADVARTAGYLTAQATTLPDLIVSQALLAEKYATVSSRFPAEKRAPMQEDLRSPGTVLRSKAGKWLRSKSPAAAKLVTTGEKSARRVLRGVLRIARGAARKGGQE